MIDHKLVIKLLNSLNFFPLEVRLFKGSNFYTFKKEQQSLIDQYLLIRYISRFNQYQFRFGFRDCGRNAFFRKKMECPLFPIKDEIYSLIGQSDLCWTSMALNANMAVNSTPVSNDEELEYFFHETISGLLINNYFLHNLSRNNLLNFYLLDEGGFKFSVCSGKFARICEMAYLSFITQSSFEDVRYFSERNKKYLQSDVYGCNASPNFLAQLYESF